MPWTPSGREDEDEEVVVLTELWVAVLGFSEFWLGWLPRLGVLERMDRDDREERIVSSVSVSVVEDWAADGGGTVTTLIPTP